MSTFQMTPVVQPGQMRFVLSWPYAPQDLDIHSIFKISRFTQCEVYFGERICLGTSLDTDNSEGGINGVETITINTLGNYVYTFAVHKYVDLSNGSAFGDSAIPNIDSNNVVRNSTSTIPDVPLSKYAAKISIYTSNYKGPMYQVNVPEFLQENLLTPGGVDNSYTWWLALCLDGTQGITSLKTVNKLSTDRPQNTYCENLYSSTANILS